MGIGCHVLPADVGVFRQPCRAASRSTCPPRRRGGVPPSKTSPTAATPSSPPTWGCSAADRSGAPAAPVLPADVGVFRGPRPVRRRPQVLPADVGVFRFRNPTGREAPCPPRRRGGVPVQAKADAKARASSPPTWGCSVSVSSISSSVRVLPADVGVFRRRATSPTACPSPPRRRGGVPSYYAADAMAGGSSPPTWGCSDGEPWRAQRRAVLPADVGVFRARHMSRPRLTRPPRRRGSVPNPAHLFAILAAASLPKRGASRAPCARRSAGWRRGRPCWCRPTLYAGSRFRNMVWRTPNQTRSAGSEEDVAGWKQVDLSGLSIKLQVRRVTWIGSSPTRPTQEKRCDLRKRYRRQSFGRGSATPKPPITTLVAAQGQLAQVQRPPPTPLRGGLGVPGEAGETL